MTATLDAPEATTWQLRPGWGIAVDLTPQEIVVAREVQVYQRLVAAALVVVLALCVGFALLARADRTTAQRDYDQEQGRTAQLAADAQDYTSITTMERVTEQVRAQLATVMGQDVNIAGVMKDIDRVRPVGVSVTSESVLLTAAVPAPPTAGATTTDPTAADPAAGATPGPEVGVTPTPQVIGSVSLAGAGTSISSITAFVTSLSALPGVIDVVPTLVTKGETGTDYTISLNLTDELYTGRYVLGGAS